MHHQIILGDCLEVMKTFPDNHFSAIVTDPPYGLHFMGKDWDKYSKGSVKVGRKVPGAHTNSEAHAAARYDERRNDEFQLFIHQVATEALRIVKPGGHVLMFGAPRRYHRQVCAIEDAGFEIRDCLMWIFGSGFPKSHNHFGIDGFGTALKPAHEIIIAAQKPLSKETEQAISEGGLNLCPNFEPIIMAMKPCDGTFKYNAEKWGQAGININSCRISGNKRSPGFRNPESQMGYSKGTDNSHWINWDNSKGRWPANVMFDEEAAAMLDEQSGVSKSSGGRSGNSKAYSDGFSQDHYDNLKPGLGDSCGASRFFYCAKASSRERNEGLDGLPAIEKPLMGEFKDNPGRTTPKSSPTPKSNHHPTVKPLALMRYLITLVSPPKNALILDPFSGSGSTILAAKQLGIDAIGIEKHPEYVEIAKARLDSCML